MNWWRSFKRGLAALLHSDRADQDVTDEVAHYLEQATASNMERGLTPDEALRAARREIGDPGLVRERVRTSGWEHLVETLFADLRLALRRLRAEPGFAGTAIGTIALGLGGAIAMFSAVHTVLLAPLPYPESERIAMVWEMSSEGQRNHGTFGMFRELDERSHSFVAMAALRPWSVTISGDRAERLTGQRVSASWLSVLDVSPALGRRFEETDDRAGAANVVIISHGLWQRRFGGDSTVVGEHVILDGEPSTVIGVMPPNFDNVLAPSAELWAPLQYGMSQGRAWGHHLRIVARLDRGVDPSLAERELNALGMTVLGELRPPTYGNELFFDVTPLRDDLTAGVRSALLAIFAAVVLLLAVACVNVANLLLGRAVRRREELAVRSALGAGVGRLVRQLLTESVALAGLGGLLGWVLASVAIRTLGQFVPDGLPQINATALSGPVAGFAMLATGLVGVVCGVIPLLVALRGKRLKMTMRESVQRTGRGNRRARSVLVTAEVAITAVLLVGSGLLYRSLQHLFAVDSGFEQTHVLTMQIRLAGPAYAADSAVDRFYEDALVAARGVPGIRSAGLVNQLPLTGDEEIFGVRVDPEVSPSQIDPTEVQSIYRYAVSPGYLETMDIPLRAGRLLNDSDDVGAPPVAVISTTFAARRLPGRDPIGWHLQIGGNPTLFRIVGVVGDVHHVSLAQDPPSAVYVTLAQSPYGDATLSLVARTGPEPETLAAPVQHAVRAVDPEQAVTRLTTMEAVVARSAAARRFAAILLQAFAVTALLLAAAGLYGVLAVGVAERTREMGVRMAVGASGGAIVSLVVRQGINLTAIGIMVGMMVSVSAVGVVENMLFGVTGFDAVTYLSVIGLLVLISLVAATVPAWRAAKVDPVEAIRAQ